MIPFRMSDIPPEPTTLTPLTTAYQHRLLTRPVFRPRRLGWWALAVALGAGVWALLLWAVLS